MVNTGTVGWGYLGSSSGNKNFPLLLYILLFVVGWLMMATGPSTSPTNLPKVKYWAIVLIVLPIRNSSLRPGVIPLLNTPGYIFLYKSSLPKVSVTTLWRKLPSDSNLSASTPKYFL